MAEIRGYVLTDNNTGVASQTTVSVNLGTIHSYTPKNKKCYCYPYNVLFLTNNNGSRVEMKPELFSDLNENTHQITIDFYNVVSANPSIFAYPQNYAGHGQFYEMGISFNNFPLIPYNIDMFKRWYSLHKNECGVQTMKAVSSLFTGVGSMALGVTSAGLTSNVNREVLNASNVSNRGLSVYRRNEFNNEANVLSGATGGADSILGFGEYIAKRVDQQRQPNQISSLPQGNEQLYSGSAGIYVSQCQCRLEFITMIDDYFTHYGYLVNETKIPDFKKRRAFDYIKTRDINIAGTIPQEDIDELESIFDNGVTIWHKPNQYGDYDVDNSPYTP